MATLLKFSSIGQFSQICKKVRDTASFHNELPGKVQAYGTVKLHGTNVAVCNAGNETWLQSRENVLEDANMLYGFGDVYERNKDIFASLIDKVREVNGLTQDIPVAIFGEFAGGEIQRKVGLAHLEKFVAIFDVYYYIGEERFKWTLPEIEKHFNPMLTTPENGVHREVYAITQFPIFTQVIDFENPKAVQNILGEYTVAIEKQCPVVTKLISKDVLDSGVPLLGEGMVWSLETEREGKLLFKVKGEKHSVTKVKTLAAVDTEKVESIAKFVEYAVTENRLRQGIDKLREAGKDPMDEASIGVFVKWVIGDTIREELDTLKESNIDPTETAPQIGYKAKRFILDFQSGKNN